MTNSFSIRIAIILSAIALSLASAPSKANDGHLVFSAAAIHFENFNERRAFTPGLGWEYSPIGKLGFHVGTVSDSFGYQGGYAGINWGTRRFLNNRVRFIVGASAVHKQYHVNAEPETKILPFPVVEFKINDRAQLNVTGSPQLDFNGARNNAVMFFQFKLKL